MKTHLKNEKKDILYHLSSEFKLIAFTKLMSYLNSKVQFKLVFLFADILLKQFKTLAYNTAMYYKNGVPSNLSQLN